MSGAVPPVWTPAALASRKGRPGETYWDIPERQLWRWDDTLQLWVAEGDGGRTGKVIMAIARRTSEESKTIESTAEAPAAIESDEGGSGVI